MVAAFLLGADQHAFHGAFLLRGDLAGESGLCVSLRGQGEDRQPAGEDERETFHAHGVAPWRRCRCRDAEWRTAQQSERAGYPFRMPVQGYRRLVDS